MSERQHHYQAAMLIP